jgi:hypothetical protein
MANMAFSGTALLFALDALYVTNLGWFFMQCRLQFNLHFKMAFTIVTLQVKIEMRQIVVQTCSYVFIIRYFFTVQ